MSNFPQSVIMLLTQKWLRGRAEKMKAQIA